MTELLYLALMYLFLFFVFSFTTLVQVYSQDPPNRNIHFHVGLHNYKILKCLQK